MTLAPALKTDQLLSELMLAIHRHPLDEFTIRRIETQAETLRQTSPEDYFMLKGACATARLDGEAMKSWFQRAVQFNSADSDTWYNFAVSCSILGYVEETRSAISEAINRFDGSLDTLQQSYSCLMQTGALRSAANLAPLARKCGVDLETDEVVASMADAIEERGFSEDDVMAVVREARQAAHAHGVLWPQPCVFTSYGFDGPTIVFDMRIVAHPSIAREVERTLFEQLAVGQHPIESEGLVTLLFTADSEAHGGRCGAAK